MPTDRAPTPLGSLLERLRAAVQLTQTELATRLSTSQSMVSRLERGDGDDFPADLPGRWIDACADEARARVAEMVRPTRVAAVTETAAEAS